MTSEHNIKKILTLIDKINGYISKKSLIEIDKLQNMQNKYIMDRNLNHVYHDPESGLPKLVNIVAWLVLFIERSSDLRFKWKIEWLETEIFEDVYHGKGIFLLTNLLENWSVWNW